MTAAPPTHANPARALRALLTDPAVPINASACAVISLSRFWRGGGRGWVVTAH